MSCTKSSAVLNHRRQQQLTLKAPGPKELIASRARVWNVSTTSSTRWGLGLWKRRRERSLHDCLRSLGMTLARAGINVKSESESRAATYLDKELSKEESNYDGQAGCSTLSPCICQNHLRQRVNGSPASTQSKPKPQQPLDHATSSRPTRAPSSHSPHTISVTATSKDPREIWKTGED